MSTEGRRAASILCIYDTDGINPYGREVAALLARDTAVRYYCPSTVRWIPASVTAHRALASSAAQDGLFTHGLRRVAMPAVILAVAIVRRRPLLVVWTRGAWDATLIALAAPLLRELVVVNHNPAVIRPASNRLRRRADALLKRKASRTIVHDPSLLQAATHESGNILIATHPPYTEWVAAYCPADEPASDGCHQVAFLGAARPDKGVADFLGVLSRMQSRPLRAVFLGKGGLSDGQIIALDKLGITVVPPRETFLSDEAMGRGLAQTDLVIAPYRDVTQSGSVLMALSAGVDVVAYDSPALRALLDDQHLVSPGDTGALAMAADAQLASKGTRGLRNHVEGQLAAAHEEWNAAVLDGLSR